MLKGYILICGNDEGVNGQKKVGSPCFSPSTFHPQAFLADFGTKDA